MRFSFGRGLPSGLGSKETPNGCVKWAVKSSSRPRIVCDLSEVGSGCFAYFVPATAPPWRQTHMEGMCHVPTCAACPDQGSAK